MQRTQIYFPKELHEDLLIGAKMSNLTLSAYIRKILNDRLYSPVRMSAKKAKPKAKASPLMIAKYAVNLGPRDLSRNFDKYFEETLK